MTDHAGWKLTDDYVRSVGRLAYLWGWPLVNMHNRLSIMAQLPGPGLLGGVVPAASPGSVGMLTTTSPRTSGWSPARTRTSCTASASSTPTEPVGAAGARLR